NELLAWFWTINLQVDVEASDMMKECKTTSCYNLVYGVHWLRASARHERWLEELSITSHEMAWIPHYFLHRAEGVKSPGAAAYAKQQVVNWRKMAISAVCIFRAVNPYIGNVWGFD
ncbi:hypothetical protein L208DRAFT_1270081, partial [Tricholoma matsutake]